MPRGGSNPGERRGGRKKGSLNRKKLVLKHAIAEGGISPLDFMLQVMRSPVPEGATPAQELAHMSLRFEAAKAAAPYCHSRMAAATVSPVDPFETAAAIREALRQMDELTCGTGAPSLSSMN